MRKRTKWGAMVLVWLLTLCILGTAAAETYAAVYGTDTLNLRAQASSSSQWLGTYAKGSWVTVTGSQNNFYSVRTSDGKTGYMSKNYLLSVDQVTYGNVAIVNNQKATAFLNLRSSPSYNAAVLQILYNGVPLTVLNTENGWYRVQMGTVTGYVRSEYTYLNYQPMGATVATIKTPNNSAVNMRTAPAATAAIRKQFAGDRYVSVLYQGAGWWYVCIDGYLGFISSDFLVEGLHAARDQAAQNGDNGNGYALVKNPISTQKLNLRTLPSLASSVVTQLANGYRLSVITQGTEWCEVFADNIAATGYVMTKYLQLVNLPKTPTLKVLHPQGSYVNLRSEPSMTSSVLKRIPSGAAATVVIPGPDWSKIQYKGTTGYVINYFTSLVN